jgi:mannose-6-phosphate isomerase-like protein (cupin superfamily)
MSDQAPKTLAVVGDKVRILLSGEQTGGAFAVVEDTAPPGGGPPPHIHQREDEGFVVIEGEFEFLLGDRWVRVSSGGSVFGKRGVPHTFRNVGSTTGRLVVTISPAGFEKFFVEVDRMSATAPPSPEQLIALGAKYGLEFLPPG